MAELTEEMQEFIVTQLARHGSPQQVANAVNQHFDGASVTRQQVYKYDPTRPGPPPAEKWRRLFDRERRKFHRVRKAEIPAAQKDFRIRELQDLYFQAKAKGRLKEAADLLEKIAKEEGGQYECDRKEKPKDAGKSAAEQARRVRDALFQMDSSMNATDAAA